MITHVCNYFGLTEDQKNLTIIYIIGAIAQTLAIWYMDSNKINVRLFVLYLVITIIWSIIYYKMFAD